MTCLRDSFVVRRGSPKRVKLSHGYEMRLKAPRQSVVHFRNKFVAFNLREGEVVDHVVYGWALSPIRNYRMVLVLQPSIATRQGNKATVWTAQTYPHTTIVLPTSHARSFLHCIRDPGITTSPFHKQFAPFWVHPFVQRHAHRVHLRYGRVEMSLKVPVRSE